MEGYLLLCIGRESKMEWIKITPHDTPPTGEFLLSDQHDCVYVGATARDYYDAVYWCPMPEYPKDHVFCVWEYK